MLQKMATQTEIDALVDKVEALEREMNEQNITSSALNGHLECGLATARKELQHLRKHTSNQLGSLDERLVEATNAMKAMLLEEHGPLVETLSRLETEFTEQAITSSAVNGHLECAVATAHKELQGLRVFTSDQLKCLGGRLAQTAEEVARLEANLTEQVMANSALSGHLECGVTTSKQELESLRSYAADQLKFLHGRLDEPLSKGTACLDVDIPWSDGFTTHVLKGKSRQSSLKSVKLAGSLRSLTVHPVDRLHASKSLPQLPAIG